MFRPVVVALIFLLSFHAGAGETLVVAAKQIRGIIDSPDSGLFVTMLRAIEKTSDMHFDILVLPPARAVHMFETGSADILLPHPHKPSAFAKPFYVKKSYIFYQCGSEPVRAYGDLNGRTVALTRGYQYDYEEIRRHTREIVTVSSDDIALRMLNQKRVDTVVGEEASFNAIISEEGLDHVCYDKDALVDASQVYLMFSHRKPLEQAERLINSLLGKLPQ